MTRHTSALRRVSQHNRRAFLAQLSVSRHAERPRLDRRAIVTLAAGLVASGALLTTMWMSMALR